MKKKMKLLTAKEKKSSIPIGDDFVWFLWKNDNIGLFYSEVFSIDRETRDRVIGKRPQVLAGLCPNCGKALPRIHSLDVQTLDIRKCEATKPGERCYITRTICKNVRLNTESCRTVQPEESWRHEVQRQIKAGKKAPGPYHKPDGTFNLPKLNRWLRKNNLPPYTKGQEEILERDELYRPRRSFLVRYDLKRQQQRVYCSLKCKREYDLAHRDDDNTPTEEAE